jgi:hypothetical protein
MQALLMRIPVGWRQVANLATTCLREWLSPRALGWPARRAAGRVQTVRAVTYVTVAFALDSVARVLAWKLHAAAITIPDAAVDAATLVYMGLALRIVFAGIRYGRHQKKFPKLPELQRPGLLRGWELALWTIMLFPWLVARHAEPTPTYLSPPMLAIRPYMDLFMVWCWANLTIQASMQTKRLKRVQASWLRRNLGYRRTPKQFQE